MKTSTRCVRLEADDQFGAISPPIYQTATFRQSTATGFDEYDYSRSGNPTRTLLERKLADLEHGAHASAFASGMAAITAVSRILEAGDEIVASDDLYGGSVRLLEQVLPRQGIAVRYVDTTDRDATAAAFSPRTKLLLVETPTNPLLRISDIAGLSEIADGHGALLAVDNTMLSPCLQNPLLHGADLVIHSATKFLCGHSDVTAGAVVTNNSDLHERIAFVQNAEGSALGAFDSWLLLRGIKTLALRVERQSSSAVEVAEFLRGQPAVRQVYYPGFEDHPGHEVHLRQSTGGGSVISFATGDTDVSRRIVESTRLCSIAVSFGSVNSSISLPCHMSHASVPAGVRDKLAPPADLIRLSVGIEDVEDIIADLDAAIRSASLTTAIATAA
jgi:cystathionine beta-lyase